MSASKYWTLAKMPNLSDKIIIVTGANSGIGYESSKAFANAGALVVFACRSIQRGEQAKAAILKQNPQAKIEVMCLDMGDLKSIKAFASLFKEKYNRLDVLLNNAGVMLTPYSFTKDGFETHLGINHLGHFALTAHLLDTIVATPQARVVNVASIAHHSAILNFEDLMYQKNPQEYSPMKAYRRSKLFNLLFTYELQRLFEKSNLSCISVAAHPGISVTNIMRDYEKKWFLKPIKPLALLFLQTPSKGALCIIRAAADETVKGGDYYGPHGKGQKKGFPVLVKSNELSHCLIAAEKCWSFSEEATLIPFKSMLRDMLKTK